MRKTERVWRKKRLSIFYEIYISLLLDFSSLLRRTKVAFFMDKVAELKGDSRALHQLVDGSLGKPKTPVMPTLTDPKQTAAQFSKFFVEKVSRIRSELDLAPQKQLNPTLTAEHCTPKGHMPRPLMRRVCLGRTLSPIRRVSLGLTPEPAFTLAQHHRTSSTASSWVSPVSTLTSQQRTTLSPSRLVSSGRTSTTTGCRSKHRFQRLTLVQLNEYVRSEYCTVSPVDVVKLVKACPTKSCPLDPIPTALLKECIDVLATPIANIINHSLSSGVFPASLKHGIISACQCNLYLRSQT